MLVMGSDVSINHGAFVLLHVDDGSLAGFHYVTERLSVAKKSSEHGTYMPHVKIKNMQERGVRRAEFWGGYLYDLLEGCPKYVGIEDYAYRISQNAHQIGEIGCLLRLQCWYHGCKIRFHGPETVKMFGAYDGTADKQLMIDSVFQRWPEAKVFERYQEGKYTATLEDLCDAYVLARLVWTEVKLRAGLIQLNKLHPKVIQVFNRCTKRWPTNVLDRDWLQRESD
jgi:hypothetical protein